MIIEISFTGQVNTSLQVGDIVYYLPTTANSGFSTSSASQATELGVVDEIQIVSNGYIVRVDYPGTTSPNIPGGSFYMFAKDNTVNLASVLGYYAEIQFVNNSDKKSEMFSIGSTVQLNSK